MTFRVLLALGAVAVALSVPTARAEAQNCVRGKPCGNACIPRNRTCRVGAGTARDASGNRGQVETPTRAQPAAPASPGQSPAPQGQAAGAPQGGLLSGSPPPSSTHPFVALRTGTFYYRRSCRAAQELPRAEVIYFRSATEALDSGRVPSTVPDC